MYPAIFDLKAYHPEAELHWLVEDAFVSMQSGTLTSIESSLLAYEDG